MCGVQYNRTGKNNIERLWNVSFCGLSVLGHRGSARPGRPGLGGNTGSDRRGRRRPARGVSRASIPGGPDGCPGLGAGPCPPGVARRKADHSGAPRLRPRRREHGTGPRPAGDREARHAEEALRRQEPGLVLRGEPSARAARPLRQAAVVRRRRAIGGGQRPGLHPDRAVVDPRFRLDAAGEARGHGPRGQHAAGGRPLEHGEPQVLLHRRTTAAPAATCIATATAASWA